MSASPTHDAYAEALTALHAARRAVARDAADTRRRRAARSDEVRALATGLADQREQLLALASELRAPLDPGSLSPLPDPPPLPWDAAEDDARARLATGAATLAEARRIGGLPQLLPQWSTQLGRAAVVYLGFTLPNVVLVVLLSLAGVKGSTPVLLWFAVVWPLVTAIGGSATITKVDAPRLPPKEPVPALVRTRTLRRYPWLGVLMAWAGWLLPGWFLDQVAALHG